MSGLALVGALIAATAPLTAQVSPNPGMVIGEKVFVRVQVTLADDVITYHPLAGFELLLHQSSADSTILRTDDSGVLTFVTSPGEYRLVSARPYEWRGRLYTWTLPLRVHEGLPTIDLTSNNARVSELGSTAQRERRPVSARPPIESSSPPAADAQIRERSEPGRSLSSWGLEAALGYVDAPGESPGLSLVLGSPYRVGPIALGLRPVDLSVYPGEDDGRYYTDTFSNGQSRCRDSETGRFVETSLCTVVPRFEYAAAADLSLSLVLSRAAITIGGGYRVGFAEGPYALARLASASRTGVRLYVEGLVGKPDIHWNKRLVQANIGVATPLP